VKCDHPLAKIDLLLVRAFFTNEKLLIVSANAFNSLAKSGSLPVISKSFSTERI
jgi:hypothetical protein